MDTLRLTVENYTFDKYFTGKGGEGGKGEWEGDGTSMQKEKEGGQSFLAHACACHSFPYVKHGSSKEEARYIWCNH